MTVAIQLLVQYGSILSDDGRMVASDRFGDYRIAPSWEPKKGDYVGYATDGKQQGAVTVSQFAENRSLGQRIAEVSAFAARSSDVWAAVFEDSHWKIKKKMPGANARTKYVSIIYRTKRGTAPNTGMRISIPSGITHVQFSGPKRLIVSTMRRDASISEYTAVQVDFEKRSYKRLWSARSASAGGFDGYGYFTQGRKGGWSYVDGVSGKARPWQSPPLFVAAGKGFWPKDAGTVVANLVSGKRQFFPGFRVRLVSSGGKAMAGEERGKLVVKQL
jgi:hypothetical protein